MSRNTHAHVNPDAQLSGASERIFLHRRRADGMDRRPQRSAHNIAANVARNAGLEAFIGKI
jgi:hypothetical protein